MILASCAKIIGDVTHFFVVFPSFEKASVATHKSVAVIIRDHLPSTEVIITKVFWHVSICICKDEETVFLLVRDERNDRGFHIPHVSVLLVFWNVLRRRSQELINLLIREWLMSISFNCLWPKRSEILSGQLFIEDHFLALINKLRIHNLWIWSLEGRFSSERVSWNLHSDPSLGKS